MAKSDVVANAENSTEYVMMLNTKNPGAVPMMLNTNGGSKKVNFRFNKTTELGLKTLENT